MTDRDEPGRSEDRDDSEDGKSRSLIRSLLAMLREMEERDEQERPGRPRPGPFTSVDCSIDIGDLSESTQGAEWRAGTGAPPEGVRGSAGGGPDYRVTSRETSDGLVVVADLPGVDAADVRPRLDHDAAALVVDVAGDEATRHPLGSDGWGVVDSRFANGVLEVELSRD